MEGRTQPFGICGTWGYTEHSRSEWGILTPDWGDRRHPTSSREASKNRHFLLHCSIEHKSP